VAGRDVHEVVRQYEHAPSQEPMHGQLGQIRRAPSTDQKKTRRELQRKADLEDSIVTQPQSRTAAIADLLGRASVARTQPERESLMLQVESLRTEAAAEHEAEYGFQVGAAKVRDTLVPGHGYERMSEETDWIIGLTSTASLTEASQEMVAQATMWFDRVPVMVKEYPEEFGEQARNMGRRLAGQFGEQAEAAEQAFLTEAGRLHTQAVRNGAFAIAKEAELDAALGGFSYDANSEQITDPTTPKRSHAALLADMMLQAQAASSLPQVADGTNPAPGDTFSTLNGGGGVPPEATDSNRAPALQEIQNYTGWDGSSVVPPNDNHADIDNHAGGPVNAASPQPGFPVGASLQHTVHKESHMAQVHVACPTCGGHGKVATRAHDPKTAYSGLPQIDQIVNADDSPGESPFPEQVAFPVVWNPNTVPGTINQAEQQIAQRNQQSPIASGGTGRPSSATSSRHEANGRDNSGWIGDMGAKGTDYPGYSTPNYGGPGNLGQPDPVYGEGGDNGNQPLKPYGAQEANDYTNNPGQNWQPGQPTADDQASSTVTPAVNTGAGMTGTASRNPYIAAAQQEILRQQSIIRAQMASQGR
jgi:hypothetical protein